MHTERAAVDTDVLVAARAALRAAHYDEVLRLTVGCEEWSSGAGEAVAVRAEALLRRSPGDALAWLSTVGDVAADDAERFAYEVITARAYAAVSNFEAAESRLASAVRFAPAFAGGAAQLALQRARLRYMQHELQPDDDDLTLAIRSGDAATQVESLIVRAFTHALKEDFAAQITGLRAALDLAVTNAADVETRLTANAAYNLARIAFETADAEATAHCAAVMGSIAWTDGLQVERFQTLRALGWDAYVRGEAGRAQWLFRDALACAPSKAWETMARLDRAHVARLSRNDAWAAEELEAADHIAADIAWSSTVGEERVVLAVLAQLLAPVDLARAQRYAATYTTLGTRGMDSTLISAEGKNRRVEAQRRYTNGCLERVSGNTDAALTALRLAYTFFDATRYRFRAALAAADLYELTGDSAWADRAREHASAYPGTPLISRLSSDGERRDPVLELLSPFQRQLARALWEGPDDEDQLSARFSRSAFTVRRETAVVFAAFGVTSRSALRAAAAERGLAS